VSKYNTLKHDKPEILTLAQNTENMASETVLHTHKWHQL